MSSLQNPHCHSTYTWTRVTFWLHCMLREHIPTQNWATPCMDAKLSIIPIGLLVRIISFKLSEVTSYGESTKQAT